MRRNWTSHLLVGLVKVCRKTTERTKWLKIPGGKIGPDPNWIGSVSRMDVNAYVGDFLF
jgi:hypothetical protein